MTRSEAAQLVLAMARSRSYRSVEVDDTLGADFVVVIARTWDGSLRIVDTPVEPAVAS